MKRVRKSIVPRSWQDRTAYLEERSFGGRRALSASVSRASRLRSFIAAQEYHKWYTAAIGNTVLRGDTCRTSRLARDSESDLLARRRTSASEGLDSEGARGPRGHQPADSNP